jgi:hypothetical protein
MLQTEPHPDAWARKFRPHSIAVLNDAIALARIARTERDSEYRFRVAIRVARAELQRARQFRCEAVLP